MRVRRLLCNRCKRWVGSQQGEVVTPRVVFVLFTYRKRFCMPCMRVVRAREGKAKGVKI
jgi:hypothetical protein